MDFSVSDNVVDVSDDDEISDDLACDGQLSLFDDMDDDDEDGDISESTDEDDEDGDISELTDEDDEDGDISELTDEDDEELDDNATMDNQLSIEDRLSIEKDISYTPSENSPLGCWTGERGNSLFKPNDAEAREILYKLGQDGINYRFGIPDFSSVGVSHLLLDYEEMKNMGDAEQKRIAASTIGLDIEEDLDAEDEDDVADDEDDLADDEDDLADDEDDLDEDKDDVADDEDNEDDAAIDSINYDVIRAVYGEDLGSFLSYLEASEIAPGFVLHHTVEDQDGMWGAELIPDVIHRACTHSGGRSKSGTKR